MPARRRVRALALGRLCDAHGLHEDALKRTVWNFLPTVAQDLRVEGALARVASAQGLEV